MTQRMSLEDAEKLALNSLKQVMEDKITKINVEVTVISRETKKLVRRTPAEVSAVLKSLA